MRPSVSSSPHLSAAPPSSGIRSTLSLRSRGRSSFKSPLTRFGVRSPELVSGDHPSAEVIRPVISRPVMPDRSTEGGNAFAASSVHHFLSSSSKDLPLRLTQAQLQCGHPCAENLTRV